MSDTGSITVRLLHFASYSHS